ncbi:MAG: hypothetical protein ISR85_01980 [Kiritimatiellales bacterium]|nr:hypothetical protein [Kiritimatiellota bacterium]MBL7011683.1 hypothetical protein [Kiritimatiellales bacterium]
MKSLKWILGFVAVVLLSGCVTGSGGGDVAGLDQLATEAAAMGKADLEAMVSKYKGLIAEKVDVAGALKAQLKEIPIADMMGEKATALKTELSDTMALISQLKDKLAVYANALKVVQP